MNNRIRNIGLVLLVFLMIESCKKEQSTEEGSWLQVKLEHQFGAEPLVLGKPYSTAQSEPITLITFKYYLSNFSLTTASGAEVSLPASYYLVDQSKDSTKLLSMNVPDGNFTGISFWIGVDSIRNVSGVQEGALDPANGMFWTWNSGYIFAKLEARSAVSPAALQAVTYHVGGFRTGENALRKVTIPLGTNISMAKGSQYQLVVLADAAAWFAGVHDISIATDPTTMAPGPLALQLADNYAAMFSLKEIKKL